MLQLRLSSLVFWTVLICLAATARADFDFPEKLGEYNRGDRREYGAPELGYSYGYRGEDSWITVYIYDMGFKNIPDGIHNEPARKALDQAVYEVKALADKGVYRDVEIISQEPAFATLQTEFLMAKFEYVFAADKPEEHEVKSFVFCRGQDEKILKVRATGNRHSDFEKELLTFMQELLAANG